MDSPLMDNHLRPANPFDFVSRRQGETKLGEVIPRVMPPAEESPHPGEVPGDTRLETGPRLEAELSRLYENGARIALIGVPESIGPRANHGRAGAELGWQAFLQSFLNLQVNAKIPAESFALIGEVVCDDLNAEADGAAIADDTAAADPGAEVDDATASAPGASIARLRELCASLDEQVHSVLRPLFAAGFEVVLVGGGHNNAYPLLSSLSEVTGTPCGAVNLDPHADFRALEGRHSGNGFSYAHADSALAHYHVLALHEGRNNRAILDRLEQSGFAYHSVHSLYSRADLNDVLSEVAITASSWGCPVGIEVDVDVLRHAPASSLNAAGVTIAEAYRYVAHLSSLSEARYLHIPEAAPALHPAGTEAGMRACGQLLTELVLAFVHGRANRASR